MTTNHPAQHSPSSGTGFLTPSPCLMESSLAKHQVLPQAHPFVLQGEQSWQGLGYQCLLSSLPSQPSFPALGTHNGMDRDRGSLRALSRVALRVGGEEPKAAMRPSVHCRGPFQQLWASDPCGNLSLSPPNPRCSWKHNSVPFSLATLSPPWAEWVHPSGKVLALWELALGAPPRCPPDSTSPCPADLRRLREGGAHQHIQRHCGNALHFHHHPRYQGESSSRAS